MSLSLRWTRDSVNGTGTYLVLDGTACGAKIQGSGDVALTAARSGADVTGRISFGNTWNPSLVATLDDSTHLTGNLETAGVSCPFALTFGLVP